ncbi:MAG: septal ring lytic transglycosylase RlpA family protein [Chitinophagaceae bacterium]|nr:septal ring lytic transglycosylase RlpA family protein [Chitinophagaceae bacterium]
MRQCLLLIFLCCHLFLSAQIIAKEENIDVLEKEHTEIPTKNKLKIYYGTASYYADKFNGRKTAIGDTYNSTKMTAACNILPLGTWIRVTNLKNKKSVIVRINDRLHPKMKRLVDLSKAGAEKLGYIRVGLAKVKVEVLGEVK